MITGQDWASYQPASPSTKDIDFALIKATEDTSYTNPRMVSQAATARSAGLVVGFYHFLLPGNIQAQAEFFVKQAASVEYDLLVCDWESSTSGSPSCAEKDAFLKAVQKLRGSNHRVLLYCNRDFWLNRDTTSFAADGLWIAEYNGRPGKPSIKAPWVIHQYTSSPVDTNVGNWASRAAMRAWARKDASPQSPQPPKAPAPSKEKPMPKKPQAYRDVWEPDVAPAPSTSPTLKSNPTWSPLSFLREIYDGITRLRADVADLRAALNKKG
ncbi:GH25 family lysozyme [Streptomyces sp. SPB074]|uniref:GH25 family lysozyme n=1 Tax=Streptomyces sp. (strain SPB074) TaxID=465543 RepID=UPI00017F1009|nr:GH25 family lysozyme [Streptomyces sp. SPB074]EDY42499.1 hydrolase [Streptomyces sp. SPB074]